MRHLFLFFAFVLVASISANAQTCSKSANSGKACCAAKKSASVSSTTSPENTQVASYVMEADAAVDASNGNITKRTCEISGATSYYEKSVCAASGKISWEEVKYDSEKKSFTKVASASMEKDENGVKVETKACCKKGAGKSCAAKKVGS